METWIKVIALSVGGSLGVNARYWLGVWMSRWTSPQFPWATFAINVSGSFLIGFLTVALARWLPHPNARLLVITGFLGGYTTFSTFSSESLSLWERGEGLLMGANLIGSVAAGFVAVVLGTVLARGLTQPADRPTAVGSRGGDAMATGLLHPVKSVHGPPIPAEGNRSHALGDPPDPDEGSRR
jgi:fluoride exporter